MDPVNCQTFNNIHMQNEPNPSCREFQYEPLDSTSNSIRLLSVKPGGEGPWVQGPDGLVRTWRVACELTHFTFREKPKYDALSYTWGSHEREHKILLNGKDFWVGRNLWNALIHLGVDDSGGGRVLWVDAICINQKDIDEQNRQLRLMPFIYAKAQTVLAWLGPGLEEAPFWTLGARDYWKRLWIVQEIGKARRLEVHWGSER